MILYILLNKVPFETRKVYEQALINPTEEQKVDEFFDFLHKRCQVLESIEGNMKRLERRTVKPQQQSNTNYTPKGNCAYCNDANHPIYLCDRFKKLPLAERKETVKTKMLCLLCLRASPKHMAKECRFKKMCPSCNKRHNGLLHDDKFQKPIANVKKIILHNS